MYIYHITNSGLLITMNGVKFLVDGIFSDKNLFNTMDVEIENQIFNSIGNFHGINCLLFTHCHEDHYDALKVIKYLENHQETKLIIPSDAMLSKEFQNMYHDFNERIILVDHKSNSQVFSIENTKVSFYKTKHLDYQIAKCEDHYSIVIEDEINRVFVAGDLELNNEETAKLYKNKYFDASFFNPALLCKKNWVENFIRVNSLKKFIYHIPSERNDRFYYRKIAIYHYNMLKNKLQNCELLLGEMQKIGI